MKKHNIHDSGYKKLFSSPELVKQLLISFVSEEWVHKIEYNTLERIDKSFISDEFAERESDLIYKAKFEGKDLYIFLLLEFQSTVDRFMALRMLRYIAELYEFLIKNQKLKKLPAVFPLMLYNGEKKWTAPEELNNLIENSIPKHYIPDFRYYKIAENEFSKDFLKSLNNAVAALFYTENCSGEELQQEIDNVVELLKSEKPDELSLFVSWFTYMFQDQRELVEEIKGIKEVKSMLRTSIKKIGEQRAKESKLEGIQEGIQKGIRKGIRVKAIDTAKILLKKKMPINEIAEITELTVEEIRKLEK